MSFKKESLAVLVAFCASVSGASAQAGAELLSLKCPFVDPDHSPFPGLHPYNALWVDLTHGTISWAVGDDHQQPPVEGNSLQTFAVTITPEAFDFRDSSDNSNHIDRTTGRWTNAGVGPTEAMQCEKAAIPFPAVKF
jgi:hypothetical protein